jgi:hypothetical protein
MTRLVFSAAWWSLLVGMFLVTDAAAQTIALSSDTLTFSGTVGGANPAAQTVVITNTGKGTLTWQVASRTGPWLSVSPPRGSAPAKLSFAVTMAGLRAGAYQDSVDLASNDPAVPTKTVVVILTVRSRAAIPPRPPAGQLAEYEVAFVYTGYTGLVDGYPNCAVKTTGTDRLTGNLTGYEAPTPGEDVDYQGVLARVTVIDICESKGRNRAADIDDEQVWCVATLVGSARMRVSLTVYGESDRGAWLKTSPDTGTATSAVSGNCAIPTMASYRTDYPGGSGGGGGSPDGQAIEDAFGAVKFVVGGFGRLRVGLYPPDPSQTLAGSPGSGWALQVIRKIR